eukprot:g3197.t1
MDEHCEGFENANIEEEQSLEWGRTYSEYLDWFEDQLEGYCRREDLEHSDIADALKEATTADNRSGAKFLPVFMLNTVYANFLLEMKARAREKIAEKQARDAKASVSEGATVVNISGVWYNDPPRSSEEKTSRKKKLFEIMKLVVTCTAFVDRDMVRMNMANVDYYPKGSKKFQIRCITGMGYRHMRTVCLPFDSRNENESEDLSALISMDDIDIEELEKEQTESHRRYEEALAQIYSLNNKTPHFPSPPRSDPREESTEGEEEDVEGENRERIHISRRGSISIFAKRSDPSIVVEDVRGSGNEEEEDGEIVLKNAPVPSFWQRILQRSESRWLKLEEIVCALQKFRKNPENRISVSGEYLLLQEVTAPLLPDPGTLFVFDEQEVPTWRDDGFSWRRIVESVTIDAKGETLTVDCDAFDDDAVFRRHAFALPVEEDGRRVWLVQYSDEPLDEKFSSLVQIGSTPNASIALVSTSIRKPRKVREKGSIVVSPAGTKQSERREPKPRSEKRRPHFRVTIKSPPRNSDVDVLGQNLDAVEEYDEENRDGERFASRQGLGNNDDGAQPLGSLDTKIDVSNGPLEIALVSDGNHDFVDTAYYQLKPSVMLAKASSYEDFKRRRAMDLKSLKRTGRRRRPRHEPGGRKSTSIRRERRTRRFRIDPRKHRRLPKGLPWKQDYGETLSRRRRRHQEKKNLVVSQKMRVATTRNREEEIERMSVEEQDEEEALDVKMMRKIVTETLARNRDAPGGSSASDKESLLNYVEDAVALSSPVLTNREKAVYIENEIVYSSSEEDSEEENDDKEDDDENGNEVEVNTRSTSYRMKHAAEEDDDDDPEATTRSASHRRSHAESSVSGTNTKPSSSNASAYQVRSRSVVDTSTHPDRRSAQKSEKKDKKKKRVGNYRVEPKVSTKGKGPLRVTVKRVRDVVASSSNLQENSMVEPYCVVWLEDPTRQKKTKRLQTPFRKGTSAQFNSHFRFDYRKLARCTSKCTLVVEVRNSDRFATRELVGKVALPLRFLKDRGVNNEPSAEWYELRRDSNDRKSRGEIFLVIEDETSQESAESAESDHNVSPLWRRHGEDHVDDDESDKRETGSKEGTYGHRHKYLKRKSRRVKGAPPLDWSKVGPKTDCHRAKISRKDSVEYNARSPQASELDASSPSRYDHETPPHRSLKALTIRESSLAKTVKKKSRKGSKAPRTGQSPHYMAETECFRHHKEDAPTHSLANATREWVHAMALDHGLSPDKVSANDSHTTPERKKRAEKETKRPPTSTGDEESVATTPPSAFTFRTRDDDVGGNVDIDDLRESMIHAWSEILETPSVVAEWNDLMHHGKRSFNKSQFHSLLHTLLGESQANQMLSNELYRLLAEDGGIVEWLDVTKFMGFCPGGERVEEASFRDDDPGVLERDEEACGY